MPEAMAIDPDRLADLHRLAAELADKVHGAELELTQGHDPYLALERAGDAMAVVKAWHILALDADTRAHAALRAAQGNPEALARPTSAVMLCKVADLAAWQIEQHLTGLQVDLGLTLAMLQAAVTDARRPGPLFDDSASADPYLAWLRPRPDDARCPLERWLGDQGVTDGR